MSIVTPYFVVFAFTALVCFSLLIKTHDVKIDGVRRYFQLLLVICGFWSLSVAIQLIAPADWKVTMYLIGLIFGISSVVAWLLFTLEYADSDLHRDKRVQFIVVGILAIIVSIKLTNPIHGLYFSHSIDTSPFVHLAVERNILHFLVTVLAYGVSLYGFVLMYKMYEESEYDSASLRILLVVMFVPGVMQVASYFYRDVFLLRLPFEPVSVGIFAIGSLIFLRGTFSNIAISGRKAVLEKVKMPSLVLVDGRVVDANAVATEIVLKSAELPVNLQQVRNPFRSAIENDNEGCVSIRVGNEELIYKPVSAEISIGEDMIGKSFVFTDITESEKSRRALNQQKIQLEQLANTSRHYMRNQAGIISGNVDLLADELDVEDDKILERTMSATDRLATISENISTIISMSNPIEEFNVIDVEEFISDFDSLEFEGSTEKTVLADANRLDKFFREFSEYTSKTEASLRNVYFEDDNLVLSHDDDSEHVYNVTDAAFKHGEIASKFISLNIIRAIADSHKWDYETRGEDGRTEIVFISVCSK